MNSERQRSVDPLLVLRMQLGDREATNALLGQIASPLGAYLRAILRTDDAEDVLQDVLLIIYRKIDGLHDPEYFWGWSYRIAAREAFRHIRRRQGAQHVQMTAEEWGAVQSRQKTVPEKQIFEQQAVRELEGLSAAGRAVLTLHYIEGMTIDEAAAHLGIATGTAKSRLSFGLEKLRRRFGLAAATRGKL